MGDLNKTQGPARPLHKEEETQTVIERKVTTLKTKAKSNHGEKLAWAAVIIILDIL